ncbi:MAG: hypothetical protein ASARMPRED_004680 [Alectoria sarmentosa]|nr:MAG: hypothetical protein ASARMPRED_004680 [Alectoria sarmentosa]
MSPRTILISGANRGTGFSILRAAATRSPSDHYLLAARSMENGELAIEELRKVTSESSVKGAEQEVTEKYARLDVLINNAGTAILESPDGPNIQEGYAQTSNTNITSVALMMSIFLPLMKTSPDARIINVSSARASLHLSSTSNLPPSRMISYSVSKTALNTLTVEYAKEEPTVAFYAASPGHCKTAFNGYGGTKDPLDGAKIIVELPLAEKGEFQNGFWQMGSHEKEPSQRERLTRFYPKIHGNLWLATHENFVAMDFIIRFAHTHETFRKPEIEALAILVNINVEFLFYSENSPYSIVRLIDEAAARALLSRSISSKGIYELWGSGKDYAELHADVIRRTKGQWQQYQSCSFRFEFDSFSGSRTLPEQRAIIESFKYMGFKGPIKMRDAQQTFTIFEEYDYSVPGPKQMYLGRFLGGSSRHAIVDYSLKTRSYINTTSMDSELALLTANLTLAAPDKLFYDPFVGTGSFPIACSHFGARTIGSDIDGRMVRGKNGRDIRTNFRQYGLLDRYLDGFISDLTHSPLRRGRWLDGIVGDPPYGIREGLKILGTKNGSGKKVVFVDGEASHLQEKYIPPKKPYSFEAMLEDLLEFSAFMLVNEGRLSLWMPTANDEDVELGIPAHPCLDLVSVCVQTFNKWSRRLLTYRRLPDPEIKGGLSLRHREATLGSNANDLNSFRKRYFEGFKPSAASEGPIETAVIKAKGHQESEKKSISDAFLAKKKELDGLKNRALEKDQELRDLESTLAQKGEERKAEIEMLRTDLGHERQAWMTAENE